MTATAPLTAADAPLVLRDDDSHGVRTLTLNRPASRNALSSAMMTALRSELAAAADDTAVRVVILAAAGPSFCAGHDLKEVRALADHDARLALFRQCSDLMQAIVRLPKPVIARVHGVATAAGCQLVASCDLAVATDDCRFATPGVNIGLFCSTPMVALSRNVGRKQAMEMLLTGEMIDAATALRFGLVNRVVPPAYLQDEAEGLAHQIASKSMRTLKIGKEAFYNQLEMTLEDAYSYCAEVMTANLETRDAAEGIGAFIEKRKPHWQDD
ncbi:MAG: enoyl-CoA hydratase [Ferrovibrionaceae bacterium]